VLLPRVFHAEGLRYGLAVLCLAGLIAGTGKPGIRGYDSIERFKALHLLLTGEVLEPPVDRKYNVSLGIMAIPLYLLGKVTATGPQEAQIKHIKTTVAHFNHVCVCGFSMWLLGWLKRRFAWEKQAAGFTVLLVLMTSLLLPHSRDFYSEVLWSITVFYAIDQLVAAFVPTSGAAYHPGKLVAAAVATTWFNTALAPIWAVLTAGLWAWNLRKARCIAAMWHPAALLSALGTALGLTLYFLENMLERGNLFAHGYGQESFALAPLNVLYVLISPGKGILWFIPTVLLPGVLLWNRRLRQTLAPELWPLIVSWYGFSVGLVLLYGSWWAWGGAGYWGPRFFLLLSIYAALLAGWLYKERCLLKSSERMVVYLVTSYSVLVIKIGLSIGQHYFSECTYMAYGLCHLTFVESPLYVFTKAPSEWLRILTHQSTLAYGIGVPALAWLWLKRGDRVEHCAGSKLGAASH